MRRRMHADEEEDTFVCCYTLITYMRRRILAYEEEDTFVCCYTLITYIIGTNCLGVINR
jgi:hypothetical protein